MRYLQLLGICLLVLTACQPTPGDSQSALTVEASFATHDATSTIRALTPQPAVNLPPVVTLSPTAQLLPVITSEPSDYSGVPAGYVRSVIPSGAEMRLGMGDWWARGLSPDRRYFAVGTSVGMYVFDSSSMKLLWSQATRSKVESLLWSTDSTWVAVSLFEWGNVLVWESQTGKLIYRLENNSEVASMDLSSDGQMLSVGLGSSSINDLDSVNAIAIWDMQTGQLTQKWNALSDGTSINHPVVNVDWSPDDKSIAAVVDYGLTAIFDARSGIEAHILEQPTTQHSEVQFLDFSPDGSKLITYTGISGPGDALGGDDDAYVWDVASGELLFTPHHDSVVVFSVWSPDGKYVATSSYFPIRNSQISYDTRIWDVSTGAQLRALVSDTFFASWSKNSQYSMFHVPGSTNYLWLDIKTGDYFQRGYDPAAIPSNALPLTFSFVSDGMLITNVLDSAPLALLKVGNVSPNLVWSPDNSMIAVLPAADSSGRITVWNTGLGVPVQLYQAVDPLPDWIGLKSEAETSYDYPCDLDSITDPGGILRAVVTWDNSREITIHNQNTDQILFRLVNGESPVCSLGFSPSSRYLAVGHKPLGRGAWDIQQTSLDDNYVTIWDMQTGSQVATLLGHTGSVVRLYWSSDSVLLASASTDDTVLIWRIVQ